MKYLTPKRIGCSPFLEAESDCKTLKLKILIDIPRQLWTCEICEKDFLGNILSEDFLSNTSLWRLLKATESLCRKAGYDLFYDDELIEESVEFAGSEKYGFMGRKRISESEKSILNEKVTGKENILYLMLSSKEYDDESNLWLQEELKKVS